MKIGDDIKFKLKDIICSGSIDKSGNIPNSYLITLSSDVPEFGWKKNQSIFVFADEIVA